MNLPLIVAITIIDKKLNVDAICITVFKKLHVLQQLARLQRMSIFIS